MTFFYERLMMLFMDGHEELCMTSKSHLRDLIFFDEVHTLTARKYEGGPADLR